MAPGGRAELHFHLLPGVDDGPAQLEDSLELARAAVADGTELVVATPHVRPDWVTDVLGLAERVSELRTALARERIPLGLRRGAELGHEMVGRLAQDELELIAHGPPRARWLLLETPFAEISESFHAAADELRDRGFGVLLAHPERSSEAALDRALGRELAAGALIQVNAGSLLGDNGAVAERAALGMVVDRRATVCASDAHGHDRPPRLSSACRLLAERGFEPAAARALVRAGPRRLLARGIPPAGALAA